MWTPMVLDTLEKADVPATFFLVGRRVLDNARDFGRPHGPPRSSATSPGGPTRTSRRWASTPRTTP
ncbi:polysaccharide deacetylase family protein [Yinghuangia aomiensis]